MLHPSEDPVLLLTALSAAADDEVVLRVEDEGYHGLRRSHGYLFQHLLVAPMPISVLAERMGMTAQGVSKIVAELEGLGYVRREVGRDRRSRLVELTGRGRGAVAAARRARAAVREGYLKILGPEEGPAVLAALGRLAVVSGALPQLTHRRLRPMHNR
ncbi:DNA-binding MarR family transcriptional regulator [Crossiella equi]|uniref:DNA-binding MarR family transcriptional regulator n=1 Tax=Crossiella equi TaxID=130796 RepID=A0ABS5AD56_9PSEU|nr:MarR family transcriptional regulator [Crossiella equi]MBP2474291.1 DNA-binding MarR family transcriptional regulator [Crossiella equi]